MKRSLQLAPALLIAAALGCGGGDAGPDLDSMTGLLDEKVAEEKAAVVAEETATKQAEVDALVAEADRLENEAPTEVTFNDMQRGQKLKGGGMLSTTLRGGIAAEQKLGLATVEHATNIFYGLEGRFPNDHDEFMERVIEFNEIKLEPLLPPYEYWYDAETNTLMKRPSQEAIDEARKAADDAKAAMAG